MKHEFPHPRCHHIYRRHLRFAGDRRFLLANATIEQRVPSGKTPDGSGACVHFNDGQLCVSYYVAGMLGLTFKLRTITQDQEPANEIH